MKVKQITKDLYHATLIGFTPTDCYREEVADPMMRKGFVYATDGRFCVRMGNGADLGYQTIGKRVGLCEKIDGFVDESAYPKAKSFKVDTKILKTAAMFAIADAMEAADKDEDEFGHSDFYDEVEQYALVEIKGKQFRARYINQIADTLYLHGEDRAKLFLLPKKLIIKAGNLAFAVMGVRCITGGTNGYSVVDGLTCDFIRHEARWC